LKKKPVLSLLTRSQEKTLRKIHNCDELMNNWLEQNLLLWSIMRNS